MSLHSLADHPAGGEVEGGKSVEAGDEFLLPLNDNAITDLVQNGVAVAYRHARQSCRSAGFAMSARSPLQFPGRVWSGEKGSPGCSKSRSEAHRRDQNHVTAVRGNAGVWRKQLALKFGGHHTDVVADEEPSSDGAGYSQPRPVRCNRASRDILPITRRCPLPFDRGRAVTDMRPFVIPQDECRFRGDGQISAGLRSSDPDGLNLWPSTTRRWRLS